MKISNNTPLKSIKINEEANSLNKNIAFKSNPNPLLNKSTQSKMLLGLGKWIKKPKKHIEKFIDFNKISMPHLFLVLTTFGFVNLPRVMHARTKDEKREIIFRDYITVATMCFAFPTLNKLAASAHRKATGVVCSFNKDRKNQSAGKRFLEHFRLLNIDKGDNVLTKEGVKGIYTNIENHKGGISGFFHYIDEQKGNIKKMLKVDDKLNEPIEKMINAYKASGNKTFDESNKAFIEMFKHAKNSKEEVFKKGIEALKKAFHEPALGTTKTIFGKSKQVLKNNKFVQNALFGTKIMSAINIFVVIPGFLGLFLPWMNEKVTKNKYTNPKKVKEPISKNTIKNIQNSRNIHFMNSNNMLNEKQKQIFKEFIKTPKNLKTVEQ